MEKTDAELGNVAVPKIPEKRKRPAIRMDGPDGGFAWIVALAACVINFIMAGLGRMSGILYVAFIDEFKVDRKQASTPFSLRSSIGNLLGPIVGILGQKYGVRAVTVMGGILGTLSAASCFFATDVTWITVLWGGLSGVGSALTVILPQVVIGQYFQKHRTTASGIAFSGGCFGAFIFPLVLEHFILNSGIEGTFLIMAGIIMNTIPAAMILRRPPWLKDNDQPTNDSTKPEKCPLDFEKVVGQIERNVMDSPMGTPVSSSGFRKGTSGRKDRKNWPDVYYLRQHTDLIVKMLAMTPDSENYLTVSLQTCQPVSPLEICILEELEDMFRCLQYSGEKSQFYKNLTMGEDLLFRDMARKADVKPVNCNQTSGFHTDTRYKHGFGRLFKASSTPDVSQISKEISSNYVLQKMRDLVAMDNFQVWTRFPHENKRKIFRIVKEVRKMCAHFGNPEAKDVPSSLNIDHHETNRNGFLDHLKTAFKLHANPLFLMVCFCRAIHFIAFIPVMTTVVDFVKDKGLQDSDGKYAIAALSVGDLLGRLCLGWVTDRGFMSMGKYMMVVMILQGASTASLPLMSSKVSLFVTFAVFGMLQGSLFVRHPVLVSKYMKSHEQSIAMGCINFFSGILGFGLPAYIGYFRDHLGSYDCIFYINGALGALVGLLWILEPYFIRRLSGKRSTKDGYETPV